MTLDDDVAVALEKIRTEQKKPFKTVVNDVLRRGLSEQKSLREPRVPYHTRSVSLGKCFLPNLDDVEEALVVAEGEDHK